MSQQSYFYFTAIPLLVLVLGAYFNQPITTDQGYFAGAYYVIVSIISAFVAKKFYDRYSITGHTRLLYTAFAFLAITIFYAASAVVGYYNDFVTGVGRWRLLFQLGNVFAALLFLLGYLRNYLAVEPRRYAVKNFVVFGVITIGLVAAIMTDPDMFPTTATGGGFSIFRDFLVSIGAILFTICFLLYLRAIHRTENPHLYYFVYGLLLFSINQFAFLMQEQVGDLLGWIGRLAGLSGMLLLYHYVSNASSTNKHHDRGEHAARPHRVRHIFHYRRTRRRHARHKSGRRRAPFQRRIVERI